MSEYIKSLASTRLCLPRSPLDFFDYTRVSIPKDLNQATSRITYNTRHYSSNYGLILLIPAIYGYIIDIQFLITFAKIVGRFFLVNRYATDPLQVDSKILEQKWLYIWLSIIGSREIWMMDTYYWVVTATSLVILVHAAMLEPSRSTADYVAVDQLEVAESQVQTEKWL